MRWILLLLCLPAGLFAQASKLLPLVNPSFESRRDLTDYPAGWQSYGFTGRPPATVFPSQPEDSLFAFKGEYFLEMQLYGDERWDAIGQQLAVPLQMDSCYELRLAAALPAEKGVRLQLLGTTDTERTPFFLAETPFIRHTGWQTYSLSFCAPQPTRYLILRPFYHEDAPKPYDSRVYLDDLHLLAQDRFSETTNIRFVEQSPVSQYDVLMSNLIDPLRQWGPQIRFDDRGGLTGWKLTEEPPRRIYHPAIRRIIRVLERFPRSELFIVLGNSPHSRAGYRKRKRTLQRAFLAAGLPKNRFTIQKWNLSTRDYEHLWPIEDTGITMRIYLY